MVMAGLTCGHDRPMPHMCAAHPAPESNRIVSPLRLTFVILPAFLFLPINNRGALIDAHACRLVQ